MNIKKYFWDLNEAALRETEKIMRNPQHPKFIKRIFTLLSRCDSPKEIFSLISRTQFIEKWPQIRRYWSKTRQSDDFKAWWEMVYEQLLEKPKSSSPKGNVPEIFRKIGKVIKEQRLNMGLSQSDVARKVRMRQPDISAIEAGKENITLETLMRLCKILAIKNIPTELD